eukprot:g1358.t1
MLLLVHSACGARIGAEDFAYLKENILYNETAGLAVLFMAPWCPHCREILPEWTKLERADPDYAVSVDCDKHPNLCTGSYGVRSYPEVLFFRGYSGGKTFSSVRYKGSFTFDALRLWLRRMLRPGVERLATRAEARGQVRAGGSGQICTAPGGACSAEDPADPEKRFSEQLVQLSDMGFKDRKKNLEALANSDGDRWQRRTFALLSGGSDPMLCHFGGDKIEMGELKGVFDISCLDAAETHGSELQLVFRDADEAAREALSRGVDGLKELLHRHGIPTLLFGRGKHKSVEQLLSEVRDGESALELLPAGSGAGDGFGPGGHGGQLCRVTHVIRAMVRRLESVPDVVLAADAARARRQRSRARTLGSSGGADGADGAEAGLPGRSSDKFLVESHQQFDDGRVRVRNVLLAEKMTRQELSHGGGGGAGEGAAGTEGSANVAAAAERGVREELGHVLLRRVRAAAGAGGGAGVAAGAGAGAGKGNGGSGRASAGGGAMGGASVRGSAQIDAARVLPRLETLQRSVEYLSSPSYPGLLTKYHLYTLVVDVAALPQSNFHTVEYKSGGRALKQKHFWKWRTRAQIEQMLAAKRAQADEAWARAQASDGARGRERAYTGGGLAGSLTLPGGKLDGATAAVISSAVFDGARGGGVGSGAAAGAAEAADGTSAAAFEWLGCAVRRRFCDALFGTALADYARHLRQRRSQLNRAAAARAQRMGVGIGLTADTPEALALPASTVRRLLKKWRFSKQERAAVMAGLPDSTGSGSHRASTCDGFVQGAALREVVRRVLARVVRARGGAGTLSRDDYTVLYDAYCGCARLELRLLHGGFSGSRVFQVESCSAATGEVEEATVAKMDDAESIADERRAMDSIARHLGENACSVMGMSTAGGVGLLKIELAGACWCLPDLRGTETPLVTLKDVYAQEPGAWWARTPGTEAGTGTGPVLAGAIGTGGRRSPAMPQPQQPQQHSAIAGSQSLQRTLAEVFTILFEPTVGQAERVKLDLLEEYELSRLLQKHVLDRRVLVERLRRERAHADAGELAAATHGALPLGVDELVPGARAFFQGFADSIASFCGELPTARGMVHGDLNGNNVLIDTEGIVWLIDFAATGRAHVLKDFAKLESCFLFEYVHDHDDEQFDALLDAVCAVTDMRLPLQAQVQGSASAASQSSTPNQGRAFRGAFETAWLAVCSLRASAARFLVACAGVAEPSGGDADAGVDAASSNTDIFHPVQYSIAMLCYSLRALSYRDTRRFQKRWALLSAMAHAKLIMQAMPSGGGDGNESSGAFQLAQLATAPIDLWRESDQLGDGSDESCGLTDDQYAHELHKYFHRLVISCSYIVDPISRQQINIMEQCVSLKVLEGDDKGDCIRKSREIDALVEKDIAVRRLNALQRSVSRTVSGPAVAAAASDGSREEASHVSMALQKLLPGTGMNADEKVCVLLGAAASGKSVLLKRVLVTSAENFDQEQQEGLVPVLILLIDLGRLMARRALTGKDKLVEAYLADRHGTHSDRYRALLRAFRARQTLLLLDGLDEAGDQRRAIERYITQTLVPADQRMIVSSRHTGFNDRVFERFSFVQLLPLSHTMQREVVALRLRDTSPSLVGAVQSELAKIEYAEMASNPLMLSMLTSILGHVLEKKREVADGTEMALSRAKLYQIGVQLMLHRASAAKFAMRRGDEDRVVGRELELLRGTDCMALLRRVAFRTHARRRRDIFSQDFIDAMHDIVRQVTTGDANEVDEEREHTKLADVYNALATCVNLGLVPLLLPLSENYQAEVAEQMLRFTHLTFQEYLCAMDIATRLKDAFEAGRRAAQREYAGKGGYDAGDLQMLEINQGGVAENWREYSDEDSNALEEAYLLGAQSFILNRNGVRAMVAPKAKELGFGGRDENYHKMRDSMAVVSGTTAAEFDRAVWFTIKKSGSEDSQRAGGILEFGARHSAASHLVNIGGNESWDVWRLDTSKPGIRSLFDDDEDTAYDIGFCRVSGLDADVDIRRGFREDGHVVMRRGQTVQFSTNPSVALTEDGVSSTRQPLQAIVVNGSHSFRGGPALMIVHMTAKMQARLHGLVQKADTAAASASDRVAEDAGEFDDTAMLATQLSVSRPLMLKSKSLILSNAARRVLYVAESTARERGHTELGTEHLVWGLTQTRPNSVLEAADGPNGDAHEKTCAELLAQLAKLDWFTFRGEARDAVPRSSNTYNRTLLFAAELAAASRHSSGKIRPEHLVAAMLMLGDKDMMLGSAEPIGTNILVKAGFELESFLRLKNVRDIRHGVPNAHDQTPVRAHSYLVDFGQYRQTNTRTGFVRKVRRTIREPDVQGCILVSSANTMLRLAISGALEAGDRVDLTAVFLDDEEPETLLRAVTDYSGVARYAVCRAGTITDGLLERLGSLADSWGTGVRLMVWDSTHRNGRQAEFATVRARRRQLTEKGVHYINTPGESLSHFINNIFSDWQADAGKPQGARAPGESSFVPLDKDQAERLFMPPDWQSKGTPGVEPTCLGPGTTVRGRKDTGEMCTIRRLNDDAAATQGGDDGGGVQRSAEVWQVREDGSSDPSTAAGHQKHALEYWFTSDAGPAAPKDSLLSLIATGKLDIDAKAVRQLARARGDIGGDWAALSSPPQMRAVRKALEPVWLSATDAKRLVSAIAGTRIRTPTAGKAKKASTAGVPGAPDPGAPGGLHLRVRANVESVGSDKMFLALDNGSLQFEDDDGSRGVIGAAAMLLSEIKDASSGSLAATPPQPLPPRKTATTGAVSSEQQWHTAVRELDAVRVYYKVAFGSLECFRVPPTEEGDPPAVQFEKAELGRSTAADAVAHGHIAQGVHVQVFRRLGRFVQVRVAMPEATQPRAAVGESETLDVVWQALGDSEPPARLLFGGGAGDPPEAAARQPLVWVGLPARSAGRPDARLAGRLVPSHGTCVVPLPRADAAQYTPARYRVRGVTRGPAALTCSPWSPQSDVSTVGVAWGLTGGRDLPEARLVTPVALQLGATLREAGAAAAAAAASRNQGGGGESAGAAAAQPVASAAAASADASQKTKAAAKVKAKFLPSHDGAWLKVSVSHDRDRGSQAGNQNQ